MMLAGHIRPMIGPARGMGAAFSRAVAGGRPDDAADLMTRPT